MPPSGDIQRYLLGVWRMMTGKRDGMRLLDISVDGFWNSFFAIVVAMPVMLAGWAPIAADLAGPGADFAARLSIVIQLAIVDIGAWVIPIIGLVLVARHVGIRDRFIHYVIASNWGSALFAWMMLPANLLRLIWPDAGDAATALSLVIFFGCLVLSWRLTDAALEKGPMVASGVFGAMLVFSIIVLFWLQELLGIMPL